jgi:hypothetical protein
VDQWKRTAAALVALVTVSGTSACAQWQAEVAAERGIPFGVGEFDGRVAAPSGLNVRAEPTTDASSLATLADGVSVRITCKVQGENIGGNPRWYKLGTGRWVSAQYVTNIGSPPSWCD